MSRNPPAGQGCTVGNYLIHYRLFQKQYWDGYRGPTVNLPMIATSGNIPPPFPYVTQGGGHRGASISVKAICRANALWGVPKRARVRGDVQESRQAAGHRRRRRRRRLPMGNHQLPQVAGSTLRNSQPIALLPYPTCSRFVFCVFFDIFVLHQGL